MLADHHSWDTAVVYQANPRPRIQRMRGALNAPSTRLKIYKMKREKTVELSVIDPKKLKEIFEIALSGHISQQSFPTTQQDNIQITCFKCHRSGPEIVKHQFHHLLLPSSQDPPPNQDSCKTFTKDNII